MTFTGFDLAVTTLKTIVIYVKANKYRAKYRPNLAKIKSLVSESHISSILFKLYRFCMFSNSLVYKFLLKLLFSSNNLIILGTNG